MIVTTVRLTTETLHRELKSRAALQGVTFSALIERYALEGMAREDAARSEGPGTTSPAAGPSEPTNQP